MIHGIEKTAILASASPVAMGGCCRVYVCLTAGPIKESSPIGKELVAAGWRLTERPGYKGKRIYVGYDNCSGRELGAGEKLAAALTAAGYHADMDYDGD